MIKLTAATLKTRRTFACLQTQMRILFISDVMHRQTHGPSRKLMLLRRAIAAHHPEVELRVLTEDPSPEFPDDEVLRVKYPRWLEPAAKLIRAWRHTRRAWQVHANWPFDVVVYNDAPVGIGAVWLRPPPGVARVLMLNDDDKADPRPRPYERRTRRYWRQAVGKIERVATRRVELVICCSHYLAAYVQRAYHLTKRPAVLYPALDIQEWQQVAASRSDILAPAAASPAAPDLPSRLPTLIFIKSDPLRGGWLDLMRALRHEQLATAFASLEVVGFNPELLGDELAPKQVEGLSINYHGPLDRAGVKGVLAKADIGVVASRHEGYGIAAREVAAAGAYLVVSDAGGLPEATEGTAHASFVAGDALSLAEALRKAIVHYPQADPEFIERETYDARAMADRFVALLRPLLPLEGA